VRRIGYVEIGVRRMIDKHTSGTVNVLTLINVIMVGLLVVCETSSMEFWAAVLLNVSISLIGTLIVRRKLSLILWIIVLIFATPVIVFSTLRQHLAHPSMLVILYWITGLANGIISGLDRSSTQ